MSDASEAKTRQDGAGVNLLIAELRAELAQAKAVLDTVEAHVYDRTLSGRVERLFWNVFWPRVHDFVQYRPRDLRVPRHYARTAAPSPAPAISVVTPSYNQGQFLEATIRSVLDQNYPNIEYAVQDGGSSDGSAAILARYRDRLAHAESRKDGGQAHAINLGFTRTPRGEIMAYLNSDDLLLPGALNYVAAYFAAHPDVDVVYGHRVIIDTDGREVGRWVLPNHSDRMLTWADYVPQETLFWRRRIWEKAGGAMDESFRFALDWDLLLRFRNAGARFARLPRFLGAFRVHAAQKTSAELTAHGEPEIARLRTRTHGRLTTRMDLRRNVRKYLLCQVWHDWLYHLGLAHR